MRTITPPCLCGHSELQHSAIFGFCKEGRGMCSCASYYPQRPLRIGWRERVARLMRSMLS